MSPTFQNNKITYVFYTNTLIFVLFLYFFSHVNRCLFFGLCFMVVFLEVGTVFQFGAFYVALLDKFQSSRAKTSAVQSILIGVILSLGKEYFTSPLLVKCIAVTKILVYYYWYYNTNEEFFNLSQLI